MTKLRFFRQYPAVDTLKKNSIVIVDERLRRLPWVRQFPVVYSVKSGEGLKDLKKFPKHFEKILKLSNNVSKRPLKIVAVGGGSVGDFAGFVASVLKRGVPLIQVPSTWLAAMDSAHGGKNALNAGGAKNQLGTICMAEQTWILQPLLDQQPAIRLEDAMGEAIKMAFLVGGPTWKKLSTILSRPQSQQNIWSVLPDLVDGKLKIVKKDPLEKKGVRHLLNLGHTLGHVFEAELGLPHGEAVFLGLQFSFHWSLQKWMMSDQEIQKILDSPIGTSLFQTQKLKASLRRLKNPARVLLNDKKRIENEKIRFIFINGIGKPKIQSVPVQQILSEIRRQSR